MLRNFRLFGLAALLLAFTASCSSNSATAFHPAVSGPAALKLCPLPNVPPKQIAAAPGFKEYVITVAHRDGTPIDGLNESDFSLSIEGRSVPISYFRTSDGKLPTAIAIVVDSSGSMKDKLTLESSGKFETVREKLSAAAQKFSACDELAIFVFGGALNAGFFHPFSEIQASELFTTDFSGAIASLAQVKPYGQTPLYDSMRSAITALALSDYPNRSLLVITDGMDNVSKATAAEVINLARNYNVTISIIGIGDPNSDDSLSRGLTSLILGAPGRTWVDEHTLNLMTADTRGRFSLVVPLQANSDQKLTAALQEFTDSIGHGYPIGVVNAGNEPIRVSVKGHPDAIVRARPAGI
jgi:VWFA-related protein